MVESPLFCKYYILKEKALNTTSFVNPPLSCRTPFPIRPLDFRLPFALFYIRTKGESRCPMTSLFPQPESGPRLVGIAKLAAQGEAVDEGHNVEYIPIEDRSLMTRVQSKRVPFDWAINPYRGCEFACKYCYARYTHEFMELHDGADFERLIFVKQQTGWVLRQELKKVKSDQSIAIGTATDPYQPAERRFGVTRAIMEELSRHQGLEIGLVTKSN